MEQQQNKTNYQTYLESDHWRLLRDACFRRDGFKCVSCLSRDRINAHHLVYRNLTDCTVHDVMTLCGFCHDHIHSYLKIRGMKSGVLGPLDVLAILRRMPRSSRVPIWVAPKMAVQEPLQKLTFPPEGDGPFIITREIMLILRTDAGGYTNATMNALGVHFPCPAGWTHSLVGTEISKESLIQAYEGRDKFTKKGLKKLRRRAAEKEQSNAVVNVKFVA